jgi:hypothetical protein
MKDGNFKTNQELLGEKNGSSIIDKNEKVRKKFLASLLENL